MIKKTAILLLATLLPCATALAQVDTGEADFTRFYALGDSLVAGEASISLVETFQVSAVPALIYRQVNGTYEGFEAPWISEAGIHIRLVLGPDGLPVPLDQLDPRVQEGVPLNGDFEGVYNNMGMSGGARVFDLLAVGGTVSCEAINDALGDLGLPPRLGCDRINLTIRDNGPAVSQVVSADPTFILLWIGGNDVLGTATSGMVIEGVTMTPVEDFELYYRNVVGFLAATDAGMVVANVPDVGDIPLVNTVPPLTADPRSPTPVPLVGPGGVDLSLGDKVTLLAFDYLTAGCGNPFAIDNNLFDPNVCPDGYLPGTVILDVGEQARITDRVNAYNDIIDEVAGEYDVALFDFNAFLDEMNQNGVHLGGISYSTDFITGGLISFDGVHPNPMASALNANEFIKVINRHFNANIPPVDLAPFVFGSAGYIGPPLAATPLPEATVEALREGLVV
jgi:lysophospholipase L1-like esterase